MEKAPAKKCQLNQVEGCLGPRLRLDAFLVLAIVYPKTLGEDLGCGTFWGLVSAT